MAWMQMQIAAGLRRLGHEAYYMEVTSAWPFDPVRQARVGDSNYALPYLGRVADKFGMGDRWAYRRSYSDHEWFGMGRSQAEDLLAHADAVLNIAGATMLRTIEKLKIGHLVYFGTDPVYPEIGYAQGDPTTDEIIRQHDCCVTYGENIGTPGCSIPPLPNLRAKTRQAILLDHWRDGSPSRPEFTTVCNWKQRGHDIDFRGETYFWSKHLEFRKFIDLPLRTSQPIELAMGLVAADKNKPAEGENIWAAGMTKEERAMLDSNGWRITNAHAFSTDPFTYQEYISSSRGEFTVAKDQNVRLRSGWFSERSACYLAAGRPVVGQDTGFGAVLPTGEGLFAFQTTEEALNALATINSDYSRHSRAARSIAEEYFRAETVLARLVDALGL
jgi:hypothetical protein